MSSPFPFVLKPFEHEGIPFDPAPHAEATCEVAGAMRHFLLKAHSDLLFFKEPKREIIYAVPTPLPGELDADALVLHLQKALEKGDVGRFVSRHLWFPKVGGATVLCVIHRADRSGAVKEWIGDEWLPLGALPPQQHLDVWAARPFLHYANRRASNRLLPCILDGTLDAARRRDLPEKWLRGDPDELNRVMLAILQLLEPDSGWHWGARGLTLSPHNAFSSGYLAEASGDFWQAAHNFTPTMRRWMKLIEAHFAFCELKWHNRLIKPWKHETYLDEALIEAGNEEFGADWRGNWYLDTEGHAIEVPAYSAPSAHEKLEAALTLKDWLRPKMPRARAEKLVQEAVQSNA